MSHEEDQCRVGTNGFCRVHPPCEMNWSLIHKLFEAIDELEEVRSEACAAIYELRETWRGDLKTRVRNKRLGYGFDR